MNGCWYVFTAGSRGTAGAVVDSCLYHAEGDLEVAVVLDLARRGIGHRMHEAFRRQPGLDFYGWLADDTYPRTRGWNDRLQRAAVEQGFACAYDGGYIDGENVMRAGDMSSGLCWAGWLLRAVGWWTPPGLTSAYIDVAWLEILRPLGLLRYLPSVEVEHRHARVGMRAWDELDEAAQAHVESDRELYHRLQAGELVEALERARAARDARRDPLAAREELLR